MDWSALGMHGNQSAPLICEACVTEEQLIGPHGKIFPISTLFEAGKHAEIFLIPVIPETLFEVENFRDGLVYRLKQFFFNFWTRKVIRGNIDPTRLAKLDNQNGENYSWNSGWFIRPRPHLNGYL